MYAPSSHSCLGTPCALCSPSRSFTDSQACGATLSMRACQLLLLRGFARSVRLASATHPASWSGGWLRVGLCSGWPLRE
eukprot:15274957-Alexandrium_andersonii.AAC.1